MEPNGGLPQAAGALTRPATHTEHPGAETGTDVAGLRVRIDGLMLTDRARLAAAVTRAARGRAADTPADTSAAAQAALVAQVEAAEQRVHRRRAGLPPVTYPPELPITARRPDILDAIRDHQVVVVAGETGSGKTTQLPKMCLELGRGVLGRIGHTQPRRIAARSVATRIAEELGTPLGAAAGFAVRFSDQVGDQTAIKVMTDGILLAEIQRDRLLLQYDTLIIDEAHERSLTIDFILGYLKALLPRRPDLKLIITSATIDPQRFARHFDDAPVIEVSGRTYPVEIRYRPLVADSRSGADDDNDPAEPALRETERAPAAGGRAEGPLAVTPARDQIEGITDAVAELISAGPGDILVFLSGEREIRDTADVLRALDLPGTEVVPLYARLSTAEQHRVFTPHPGRRIILATNVAETSLTVPGIRYVVDAGQARISRYSHRTKVQRLPIEAISQASARQRAGRCGRLAEGICVRLYSQTDFEARPEFTDPEILRTSLAAVILQMAALGLGDIADFGFLDPPDRRSVRDGRALLNELGALDPGASDPNRAITALGRRLAQLPVDPRLGRMLLAADEQGALTEVIVIAAALSIQDPRERPAEHEAAAQQLHARFRDEHSDFTAYLNLSRYLVEQQQTLSGNQFRRLCRAEYLHYLRIREWQDLVSQLRRAARSVGMTANREPASDAAVHTALLAGLLSQIGSRTGARREYQGTRNARFVLAPGSALAARPPGWVMAAELVETSRLYARTVARTDPETIERLAGHLVTRSYSEPRWDERRGAATATERVTLYGLPLITGRTVPYARIDPAGARELFIQHALVEGQWTTRHRFFHDNRAVLADVAELEQRLRRRDIVVDDAALRDFYDERIPAEVVSARHFDTWWKQAGRADPQRLRLTRAQVIAADVAGTGEQDFPDQWRSGDLSLPITYRFAPGADDDGVTLHVPLDVLNRIDPDALAWPVPAHREDLITALLRALPKPIRRELGPAPDRARALAAALAEEAEEAEEAEAPHAADAPDQPADHTPAADHALPLLARLEREIRAQTGVIVPREAWALNRLPVHLQPGFVVEDGDGRVVATGRDLRRLQRELAEPVRALVVDAAPGIERSGLHDWDFGDLPRTVEHERTGRTVRGFPALVDETTSVAIRVLTGPGEQHRAMLGGLRRLLRMTLGSPAKAVLADLGPRARLTLSANPDGSIAALTEDVLSAVLDALIERHGGPVWDAAGFGRLQAAVRPELAAELARCLRVVERILAAGHDLDLTWSGLGLADSGPSGTAPAAADLRRQRERLLYPGFVTGAGTTRLGDVARYLSAMARRLERLPREGDVDAARMARVQRVEQAYEEVRARVVPGAAGAVEVERVRWMIEELRVSLFAQRLGTAYPISEQRIYRALDAIVG